MVIVKAKANKLAINLAIFIYIFLNNLFYLLLLNYDLSKYKKIR